MKLYLRTTLAVFAALMVAFSVMMVLKSQFVDPKWRNDLAKLSEPKFEFMKEMFDALPPAERLQRLRQMDEKYSLETRFLQGEEAERIRRGKPSDARVWPVEYDDKWYFAGDFGEGHVILAGPLLHPKPSPWMHWLGILLGLVSASAAAAFVIGPVTRRVRGLRNATQQIAEGNMEARASVGPDDVLGQLETNFNGMADKIEGLLKTKRELLQAVSHELRTPITKLRFAAEMYQDAKDPTTQARHAGTIESSLDELDALVDELLTYARFDDSTPELERKSFHLETLIGELEREAQELGVERTITFEVDAKELFASYYYLRRALSNGLGNAIRYANKCVHLHAFEEGEDIVIWIEDDGPGVPEEQRERVFDAFTRTDDSRCRESGGAGLGLAIIDRIMSWHQGTAHIEDATLGGARLVLRFPGGDAKKNAAA